MSLVEHLKAWMKMTLWVTPALWVAWETRDTFLTAETASVLQEGFFLVLPSGVEHIEHLLSETS